jgi:hypothetical protein
LSYEAAQPSDAHAGKKAARSARLSRQNKKKKEEVVSVTFDTTSSFL